MNRVQRKGRCERAGGRTILKQAEAPYFGANSHAGRGNVTTGVGAPSGPPGPREGSYYDTSGAHYYVWNNATQAWVQVV